MGENKLDEKKNGENEKGKRLIDSLSLFNSVHQEREWTCTTKTGIKKFNRKRKTPTIEEMQK